jgi:hypothetical protein
VYGEVVKLGKKKISSGWNEGVYMVCENYKVEELTGKLVMVL